MNDPKLKLLETNAGEIIIALQYKWLRFVFYSITRNAKFGDVKTSLERNGFDTTFAHWNADGSLSHLTRPLEIMPGRVAVPGADGLFFQVVDYWVDNDLVICLDNNVICWFLWRMHTPKLEEKEVPKKLHYRAIDGSGFNTDFANWTESGQFAGLKQ